MARRILVPGTVLSNLVLRAMTSSARARMAKIRIARRLAVISIGVVSLCALSVRFFGAINGAHCEPAAK
jgi:hypothetical protein